MPPSLLGMCLIKLGNVDISIKHVLFRTFTWNLQTTCSVIHPDYLFTPSQEDDGCFQEKMKWNTKEAEEIASQKIQLRTLLDNLQLSTITRSYGFFTMWRMSLKVWSRLISVNYIIHHISILTYRLCTPRSYWSHNYGVSKKSIPCL